MEFNKQDLLAKMKTWRRTLHQHPEISFEEVVTSNWLQEKIKAFGAYHIQPVGKTSFIATIEGGKAGNKETIAFRTDMDALPITEETGLGFASENPGVMHACGHDVHMAMLLGLAEVLASQQAHFSNCIKLVFQCGEETPPGGAIELMNSGYLDDVAYIYGLHIFPNHPVGHVGIASGPITASQDIIDLRIEGVGTHGASPELGIDPILVGAELVSSIHHIVSRNISPFESAVISFGQFNAGDIFNVIPDIAIIKGNVRTTNSEVRALIKKRVTEVVKGVCLANNAKYQLNYTAGYGPVVNHPEATARALKAGKQALGDAQLFLDPQKMVSEDFSEYTQRLKGCFMILGGGEARDGYQYMNHHPKFNINEEAMLAGLKMYVELVKEHSAS